MDFCLEIENLRFHTIIGILESERIQPQEVLINAKIYYRYKESYLDYVSVVEAIQEDICTNAYGLLEELIEQVCENLKHKFPAISMIRFHITKPQILKQCNIGISAIKEFV